MERIEPVREGLAWEVPRRGAEIATPTYGYVRPWVGGCGTAAEVRGVICDSSPHGVGVLLGRRMEPGGQFLLRVPNGDDRDDYDDETGTVDDDRGGAAAGLFRVVRCRACGDAHFLVAAEVVIVDPPAAAGV